MDKVIKDRIGRKSIGFGAEIEGSSKLTDKELFRQLLPEDLLKFGMIPEFVGRVPVVVALDELDEDALVKVMQEPKNALIKQYKKLMRFDDVELVFEPAAIREIAKEALELKTGARGLRTILERLMLDVMYEIPSCGDVCEVLVTEKSVRHLEKPRLKRKKKTTEKKVANA